MAGFSGSAAFAQWVTSNGTTTLTGDQTSGSYDPSVEMYDETAGADANLQYIAGRTGGKFTINSNQQASDGTLIFNQLVEGKLGTMTWGEQGSITTKPKHSAAFYSLGAKQTYPYNNIVVYSCDFQQTGTRTDGTF
jgi:hypothetical protein